MSRKTAGIPKYRRTEEMFMNPVGDVSNFLLYGFIQN